MNIYIYIYTRQKPEIYKEAIKNEDGEVVTVHCNYDQNSKGGWTDDGRKVRGTLPWVSAKEAINAEVRLYDRLFTSEKPLNTKKISHFIKKFNIKTVIHAAAYAYVIDSEKNKKKYYINNVLKTKKFISIIKKNDETN